MPRLSARLAPKLVTLQKGSATSSALFEVTAEAELTDNTRLLRDGMELFVGYLTSAQEGWGDEDAPQMH